MQARGWASAPPRARAAICHPSPTWAAQLPAQGIAGRSHECHGSNDCAGQRHHRGRLYEQFERHHLPRPRRPAIGCLRCRRGAAIVAALMEAAWECAAASLLFVSHRNGVPEREDTFRAPSRMRCSLRSRFARDCALTYPVPWSKVRSQGGAMACGGRLEPDTPPSSGLLMMDPRRALDG